MREGWVGVIINYFHCSIIIYYFIIEANPQKYNSRFRNKFAYSKVCTMHVSFGDFLKFIHVHVQFLKLL